MVRFSCFHSHLHSHKPKKTVQVSAEAMSKSLEDYSENQAVKNFTRLAGTTPLQLKEPKDTLSNGDDHVPSPSSIERDWKSEELKSKIGMDSDDGVQHTGHMKKSLSLGSGLDRKGTTSANHESEYESSGSHNHIGLVVPVGGKDPEISLPDQYQEALPSDSLQLSSNMVNNGSIFTIEDPQQSEKEDCENFETQLSGECAGESNNHTPRTPPAIVRSNSLPNIGSCGGRSSLVGLVHRNRSSEDLKVLDSTRKDMPINYVGTQIIQDQERDDTMLNVEKNNGEYPVDDSYDAYIDVGSPKDWIVPVMDEVNKGKNIQEDSSGRWEDLPSRDFKIKRIQKWVMDLQHCSTLEETNGMSTPNDQVQSGDTVLDGLTASKVDAKVFLGMEAAKKYISSLSASATTAQLANHGLVVIPFLSAFASLKALNISGNAIVRITAGALPRGLHILNLSKNNISTIEGLRELTRLRVLDLSYNRILRIGHGLASCSSLKELYLAGNKISEVEGLHRLLKLNVLDLRFNKLSTTKSLGQLAANYISLQAISLEGNPAQKNVGDEKLKKYLQGLLPHLAYFNRQSIKSGAMKDAADRAARLGISAHQKISESKTARKASHGVSSHKISSSIHGRKSQAVAAPKPSRGSRHGRLPPSGVKATTDRQLLYDFSSKLMSFRPELSIHRSHSEGTLGVI